jgi:ATP-dependent Clp protease ATP-binding subunit ClpA
MEIEINDVLVALTSEPTAAGLPAERGVDEDSVRAAIERRDTFEQPPEASATPTCGCDDVRVFERFTERARRVVVLAQTEARELRFSQIGTESVLLGLLREDEGVAARVLESLTSRSSASGRGCVVPTHRVRDHPQMPGGVPRVP